VSAIETVSTELIALVRGLRELHGTVTRASSYPVDTSGATILARLDQLGPSRLSTLAAVLCLDVSTVSRQVPVLERQGWVARERDPQDHRAQLLELTPLGRDVLTDVRRASHEALSHLLPDWTDAELKAFAGQLARFNDDVTRHRPAVALTTT
jgi:DNA-binding MarR family transcriptional regulator